MAQVSLIDIKSGKLVEQATGSSTTVGSPSIVKISLNPETLKSASRAGNDLVIVLKSGEQVVLKGFFIVAADGLHNELVLENEGKFWHATYEPSQASLTLKEISNVDELLVEDGDNTFMWLLGALGLGGVVALASGGGGGGGGHGAGGNGSGNGNGGNGTASASKPAAPVVSFNAQTNKLIVQGRPGAVFEVKGEGGQVLASGTLDNDGLAQVELSASASHQTITTTQTANGLQSDPSVALTLPLMKPTLGTVDPETGELLVTGVPGGTAQVVDRDGNPIGEPVRLDPNGQGTLTVPGNTSGQQVGVVVTVEGEKSPPANVKVPVLVPQVGVVDPVTGELVVTGPPGGTAQVVDRDGNPIGEPVRLDPNGQGTLTVPGNTSGQQVGVVVTVEGEKSPPANVKVPLLVPQVGVVDPATGELVVTGPPGGTAQVVDRDGNPIGEPVRLDPNGQGTLTVPGNTSGQQVGVVVTVEGEKSPTTNVQVPLLAPQLGPVDPVTGNVVVTGKAGATAQVVDKDGNPIGEPVRLDPNGQGTLTVPGNTSGEKVGVVITDGDKQSPTTNVQVPLFVPVFGVVDAVTGQVSVEGKPNGIVQINNPDGTIVRVPLDADGKGSVVLPSGTSGENLKATVSLGSLESAPVTLQVPVLAPRNAVINNTGSAVTVEGKPGEIIKVTDANGKELGSGVVSKAGSVEIALSTPQKTGAILGVTAYNAEKASPTVSVVAPFIDADLPLPPTDLSINPSGTRVLGKVKPDETVKIVNVDTQQELGTFTPGPDGLFSANIPAQTGGAKLAISAVKGDKVSAPAQLLVPLSPEDTIAKPFDVSVDVTGTKVKGKGTPNTIVLIKATDDTTVIAKGLVGPDGNFEVTIPVQPGGQLLNVALQANGKVSESESVITPYIASNTPTEVLIDEAGTHVTGKGVTGETIRVKDAQGKVIGSGVVQVDGTFVVNIPKQPSDSTLAVTAQGQGVESAPAYVKTPATEVERPPQPEAHLDTAGTQISGKTLPGASISVKDASGQLLAGPIVASEDGTFAATIAKQPAGSKITVVAELGGKESLPTELIAPQVPGEPIPAPLSAMISADGKLVSGKATPNTKVVVKNAAGETLGEQPVDADGNYAVPIKAQMGGAVLQVTSASLDNQSTSTGSVSVTAPYQLVAEHNEVTVSQFIDPNIANLEQSKSATFVTVGTSFLNWGANFVSNGLFGFQIMPTSNSLQFVVSDNEKVQINIFISAPFNIDLVNYNSMTLEKLIDGKWVNVSSSTGGGLLNVSVLPIIADKSGISLTYEMPGEYRVTANNLAGVGVGAQTVTTEVVHTSFVGGFANSAIKSDLILPAGATLLKVNGTTLASEVRTVVKGQFGDLTISADGQATYRQNSNSTPSDQTETFTYEARTAGGAILKSSFHIDIKAYSVSGDLVSSEEASIVSVDGKSVSSINQETIVGKYGDLKIAANGEYTYTPKLSLTGLNEIETFSYQVRHTNGETVTSTLAVKIADSKLVAELNEVPTSVAPAADLAGQLAQPESQVDRDVDSDTALPSFNLGQGPNLDVNKVVSLQAKDDPAKPALTVTLNDILQADGTLSNSKSTSASTLDLPDSWKPDGVKASLDGHEYVHYIDGTSKKDLWVESGVSVV
ncbi:Ig-like domain-containing protein [Pseudomonas sp. A34-9]|uniref:Ig-like domain-containing protein n=1 Tax=Pseudomonas sp. A34-9 TaxID=3034675 RepID=UPI00240E6E95|nr:Ig-like domain-containing protein [Pseudomonas sp. A34-9]